jgi:hypothetical protein
MVFDERIVLNSEHLRVLLRSCSPASNWRLLSCCTGRHDQVIVRYIDRQDFAEVVSVEENVVANLQITGGA